MSWTELPPDFKALRFAGALKRLPLADAIALTIATEKKGRIFLINEDAGEVARQFVSRYRHESGGLLLGKVYKSEPSHLGFTSELVVVSAAIPADVYSGTSTALRMQPELWRKADAVKGRDEFVVGWFHSHPNLGAFFSGTDRRTQAAFFSLPHTIAWVIDPVRKDEAWFNGPQSQPIPIECLYFGLFGGL